MANIKSAKKRIATNETKRNENAMIKSELRTFIKKVKTAVEAKDAKGAKELLTVTFSKIDKAVSKNIIHINNAARKKAALSVLVDSLNSAK